MRDVLLPTLAVAALWLGLGLVLGACGFLVRRALVGGGPPTTADLWIGLAALLAYLELWSLVTGISAFAWIGPGAAAAGGAVLAFRGLERRRGRGVRPGIAAETAASLLATVVGVLWLANRALGPAADYDLGLYHAGAVRWALDYGTVTGLANLQSRLGSGDAHLLLVAFLQHGPWAGAASHLADGLLVSLLAIEILTRAVRGRRGSFTRRLALLLVPAVVAVVGVGPSYRLASPNLDVAAFVLVAVGALYLAECVEDGVRPVPAIAALGAFTGAAATRPVYFLPALVAAVVFVVGVRRRRVALAVCALPAVLAGGWLVRQALLSGYPFFPATVADLPVGWRVPVATVEAQNRWTDSWARWPGQTPDVVNASWHWLSVWAHLRVRDFDVMAPAAMLAAVVPAAIAGAAGAPCARNRFSPWSSPRSPSWPHGSPSRRTRASRSARSGCCRRPSPPGRCPRRPTAPRRSSSWLRRSPRAVSSPSPSRTCPGSSSSCSTRSPWSRSFCVQLHRGARRRCSRAPDWSRQRSCRSASSPTAAGSTS